MANLDMFLGDPITPKKEEKQETASPLDQFLGSPVSSDRPSIEVQTEEMVAAPEGVRDLTNDAVFAKISPYMKSRFGMSEDKYDRQEIVDAYVNNMRKFNFGQSVVTVGELSYLNGATEAEKAEAASAYQTFDSMKGAFAEGTSGMEKLDAVYDYGRALIVDPVNVVSLGIGKLITGGGSKAAAQLAKEGVKREVAKIIQKQGLTQGAKQAAKQVERKLIGETLRSEAFKKASKRLAVKEALYTGAADTVAGVSMDAVYQQAMQEVGLQSEYDLVQGSIAAAGGTFGTGLSMGLSMLGRSFDADSDMLGAFYFDRANTDLARAREIAGDVTKSVKEKLDLRGFQDSLPDFQKNIEDFADKVERGSLLRLLGNGQRVGKETQIRKAFYLGDEKLGFKGIADILADNGVRNWTKRTDDDNFSNWMHDLIREMPKGVQDQLDDIFRKTLGKAVPDYKGKSLLQALDMDAKEFSVAGQQLNILSQAARTLRYIPKVADDEILPELIKAELPPVTERVRDAFAEKTSFLQRNLIRMLVTHPGTTALNLIGWQTASTMQSLGDIVRGTLYGGASVINAAVLNKEGAAKFAKKAGLMLGLQKQKMRNLLDPNMTYESFMDFLAFNPAAQKDMLRYMAGGVDIEQMSRDLQLEEFAEIAKDALGKDAIKDVSRTKLDKIMDKIQLVYGVKLQDMATKSQEFMYAIDKQMRLKYDMTYVDFLNDPNMWKRMMGDDYAEIVSTASQDALRNVFSKSYADSKTPVGTIAGFIESLSRQPVIGAMVPFGQFFNNTMAHIMDHTGISLAHKYWAGTTRDPMELLTKTAVGLTSIGVLSQYEKENLDAGLAWYEERASDGSIRNRLYDFPYIFYKAIGRMGAHIEKDGTVPRELFDEVVLTFGPGALTRQLDDNMKGMYDIISDAVTAEDPEYGQAVVKVIQNTTSMYASGYTRFLDPVNLTASMMKGEAYVAPDRKQGAAWVNNSVRYSDELLESIGAYVKPEKKYQSITTEGDQVPIGKVFGVRFSPATSSAERAFNEAGIADWKTNIRTSIPEARNDMNRIIAPILEYEFGLLLEKPKWKSGNPEERKQYIYDTINTSKQFVKEILANSFDPEDTRSLLLYKLGAGEYANKRRIQNYQKEFGLGDEELTDLELPQLQLFVGYVELMEELRKDKREE